MGVPRLYKWLVSSFPQHIYHSQVNTKVKWENLPLINEGKQPDNFYIDAVSILHNFASEVFKYGDNALKEGEVDEYAGLGYNKKIKKVYQLSMDYSIALIKSVNPKYLAYYSLDGVAPLAKQGQQRQRRFLSAKGREETKQKFDSNIITAGSTFTYDYSLYAKFRFLQCADQDEDFKKLKVIFSSSNVPGEGEHKIMNYIRHIKSEKSMNSRHVLYGPDGDLIMLALCTHLKDFWIIRENFFKKQTFDLVDIGNIYKKIYGNLSLQNIKESSVMQIKNIIHDFVLMGFFLGNDFLPKIQMIDMLEEGLETLIDKYKKIKKERSTDTREWNLTHDGQINNRNFQHFINSLAGLEKFFLISQLNRKCENEKFKNNTLFDSCSLTDEGKQYFHYDTYEVLYTAKKLNNNADDAVKNYFDGLNWVLEYYVSGCPHWMWIYPYHHAPLMKHMSSAVNDTKLKNVDWEDSTPVLPFRQMMCVIPPLSKEVLHENLRFVYDHNMLKKYYPGSFEIDFEGKKQDWQGVAMLPFINQKDMDEVYENVAEDFTEIKENKVSKNLLIRRYEDLEYNYKCKFGKIEEGNVNVKQLNF